MKKLIISIILIVVLCLGINIFINKLNKSNNITSTNKKILLSKDTTSSSTSTVPSNKNTISSNSGTTNLNANVPSSNINNSSLNTNTTSSNSNTTSLNNTTLSSNNNTPSNNDNSYSNKKIESINTSSTNINTNTSNNLDSLRNYLYNTAIELINGSGLKETNAQEKILMNEINEKITVESLKNILNIKNPSNITKLPCALNSIPYTSWQKKSSQNTIMISLGSISTRSVFVVFAPNVKLG